MTSHVRKDLSNQSFAGQDLRGWSFEQCNLTGADFRGAVTDETTVLFACNIAGIRIDFGTRAFDALLVKCYGRDAAFKAWDKQTSAERLQREREYKREWRAKNRTLSRSIANKARRRWERANPERLRAIKRTNKARLRVKKPELVRQRDRERKQRWRALNVEREREIRRRADRRYRQKQAELAEVGTSPSRS